MRGRRSFGFWWRWLLGAALLVVGTGAVFLFAPATARTLVSLLFYGSLSTLGSLSTPAVRYIDFAHGVLGAVMIGWGTTMVFLLAGPLRRASLEAWRVVSYSLAVWYLLDSGLSVYSGFWQNAILNSVLVLVFIPPLWGVRAYCMASRAGRDGKGSGDDTNR